MKKRIMSLLIAMFGIANVANAQTMTGEALSSLSNNDSMSNSGWTVNTGMQYIYHPAFLGSKDYYSQLFPAISINYEDKFFLSDTNAGYNVINNGTWRLGPLASLEYGRSNNDSDNLFRIGTPKSSALDGLPKVDDSLGLGGFVEYTFMEHFKANLELRQAVNGNDGFRGDFKVYYENTIGPLTYSFGPRISAVDERYMNAFFAIDDATSRATGLGVYGPHGGVLSYGLGGRIIIPLTKHITASYFWAYDRLGNEDANSPIVTQRGAPNQYTNGLTVSYNWKF